MSGFGANWQLLVTVNSRRLWWQLRGRFVLELPARARALSGSVIQEAGSAWEKRLWRPLQTGQARRRLALEQHQARQSGNL